MQICNQTLQGISPIEALNEGPWPVISMKIITNLLVFGLSVALATIISLNYAFAQTVTVEIEAGSVNATENKGFNPKEITIMAGTTISWHNGDITGHTVTSGDQGNQTMGALFDSGFPLIKPGATFEHEFGDAGEFPYFCQVHPWMTGNVIVEPAPPPPALPIVGTILPGENMDLVVNPLPFDRPVNETITLTFKSKGADDKPMNNTDWSIDIEMQGTAVFSRIFHDNDGVLELQVTPTNMTEIEVGKPSVNDTETMITSAYPVTGPIFMENGQYQVHAKITGIDFKPLPSPIEQDFSIDVVPEFPMAPILPLLLAFAAIVGVMRMKQGKNKALIP